MKSKRPIKSIDEQGRKTPLCHRPYKLDMNIDDNIWILISRPLHDQEFQRIAESSMVLNKYGIPHRVSLLDSGGVQIEIHQLIYKKAHELGRVESNELYKAYESLKSITIVPGIDVQTGSIVTVIRDDMRTAMFREEEGVYMQSIGSFTLTKMPLNPPKKA